jgi:hypothetical protein
MTDHDIRLIVRDLDRWALGERGSNLTWALIVESSSFSRQTLNAHPKIKAAYDAAKKALRDGGIGKLRVEAVADNESLIAEVARLREAVSTYEEREIKWKARWQRMAYHIRAKGYQVSHIDRPLPDKPGKVPSEREGSDILRDFDQAIPPSGRV